MGSPPTEVGRNENERRHSVKVEGFRLSKYEVTKGQFSEFVAATSYRTEAERGEGCNIYTDKWETKAGAHWRSPENFTQDEDEPVVCVSWTDAMAYIKWVNQQTGERYRLPTEAEWEYAARAGSQTLFNTGYCINTDQANYNGNYDYDKCGAKTGVSRSKTTPVGSLESNEWGLYDMHGNVWEWTCSLFNESYDGDESKCAKLDGNEYRSLRGGSWGYRPKDLRSAYRSWLSPTGQSYGTGFRLAQGK